MNNLKEIQINYIDIESIINIYKQDKDIDFKNLGLIIGKRSIICQILYREKELIKTPYGLKVNPFSYIAWREKIVEYMVDLSITKYQLGRKETTINGTILNIVHFVNWINNNSYDLDDNIDKAVHVFRAYTVYLKGKIRNGSNHSSTASTKQLELYNMLSTIYKDKENILGSSIKFIKKRKSTNKTEKSLTKNQQYHYKFHYDLFHQISDFVLEDKLFPLQINLVDKRYWIIPSRKLFYKENDTSYPYPFEQKTGETKTIDALVKEYNITKRSASLQQKNFKNTIESANKFQSRKKFIMASYGLKAFYILFLTNTGMNDSTAATLKWDEKYILERKRHKFKNIKYRAGDKLVEFEIGNNFVKEFKKFLKLRNYLLCKNSSEYLFFLGFQDLVAISPRQKQGTFSSVITRKFKKYIDSDLPIITSRQLRVNKTYQTIKHYGIVVASQTAQTSINTLIQHYQGTSNEIVENELENYFISLNNQLIIKEKHQTETAIGWCNDIDKPKHSSLLPNTLQGCHSKEGCLFCENYRIHTDKHDIHKLFSLQYIINECRYIANNEKHFASVYGIVLKRINNILKVITTQKKMTEEEINTIYHDVFENENLHPYWEHKLKLLLSIGVLK